MNRGLIRVPSGEQPRTRHGARPVPLCRIPSGAGDDPKVRRPAPAEWITEVTLRDPILTKFGNSAGVHPEIRAAVSRICEIHRVSSSPPLHMHTLLPYPLTTPPARATKY